MRTPTSQRTGTSPRTTALAGVVLAGVLGVSACGGDSDNDTNEGPDAGTSADDGAPSGDAAATSGDADTPPDDAAMTGGADGEAAPSPELDDIPEVVAEVEGEEISSEDFATAYEAQFQQASMQSEMGGEPVDQEALQQQVLDGLIDNQLLALEAEQNDLTASEEEIDTSLEELATGNGMETEDFLAALEEQGLSEEDARTEVGNQLSTEKLIEQEVPVEDPSDEELQQRYDEIAEQQEAAGSGDDAAATGAPEMELPPFEEVRDQLAEQMRSEEQSVGVQDYLEELRSNAEITSNL